MTIAGKYELVSTDKGYGDYLKEIGVGMLNRGLATSASPSMEYIDLGNGKWTQKTSSTLKSFEVTFTLGQEFDEKTADDRKSKSLITIEGNTLTHKQNIEDKYQSVTTRVFNGNDMKTTFKSGDKVAVRVFKKVA